MTRDEIIAMAVQAGMETMSGSDELFYASIADIIRFSALVAAKERDAMAQEQADARMDRTFTEPD